MKGRKTEQKNKPWKNGVQKIQVAFENVGLND